MLFFLISQKVVELLASILVIVKKINSILTKTSTASHALLQKLLRHSPQAILPVCEFGYLGSAGWMSMFQR